jgi:hypothetical protein
VGTGFAVVENLNYLQTRSNMPPAVWIIRGFGTAAVHGGASSLFAIITKLLSDVQPGDHFHVFLPGTMVAVGAHSFYSHLLLPPLPSAAAALLIFPALVLAVYRKCERSLQQWLGMGFNSDVGLIGLTHSDRFPDSRIGRYLESLRRAFAGPVVSDMLRYVRLQAELAARAKGALLMRNSGFPAEPEPAVEADFRELERLGRRIGCTGRRVLSPFSHFRSQEYWKHFQLTHRRAGV